MRVLSIARVLFTLLALQLAVGFQIGAAYASAGTGVAAAMQMPAAAGTMSHVARSDEACPMHSASASGTQHPLTKSGDKHDCCKSSGCQCQCGNVPFAFDVSVVRNAPATAPLQQLRTAGPAAAPTETHFRPPIAS